MAMWQFSVETCDNFLELEGHSTLLELLRAVRIISSLFCKWLNQTQRDEKSHSKGHLVGAGDKVGTWFSLLFFTCLV